MKKIIFMLIALLALGCLIGCDSSSSPSGNDDDDYSWGEIPDVLDGRWLHDDHLNPSSLYIDFDKEYKAIHFQGNPLTDDFEVVFVQDLGSSYKVRIENPSFTEELRIEKEGLKNNFFTLNVSNFGEDFPDDFVTKFLGTYTKE